MRGRIILASLLAAVAAGSMAIAGPAPVTADYSADEFTKAILNGPLPCDPGKTAAQCEANPKTRRWALYSETEPSGVITPAARKAAPKARAKRVVTSKDILVTFALGSADITPRGQANLEIVASSLKGPLATLDFEVAGYTDVVGTAERNQLLSEQRAEAVKAFLIARGVSADRLKTKGYGLDHLADPTDPKGEINRRVELHRLS